MAQIVTITNPLTGQPAQVDQLEHTAQQIDDGVKRALEYGLGGNVATAPVDSDGWANANLITETGFYRAFTNTPLGGWNYIIHVEYSAGNSFQIGFYGASATIAIRCKLNTVWQPWEYINPPMTIGEEYRTTERYQGKPVYAQALSVGDIAANNMSVASSFSTGADTVVRSYAVAKYSNGSNLKTPQNGTYLGIHFTADGFVYSVNNQVRVNIMSDKDMTDCVAVAYYTKE